MVRSLNSRFSHYFTPRENALFRQATSGEFSGVGMTVVEHPRGSARRRACSTTRRRSAPGIRPGDVITRVNGRSIAGRVERRLDRPDQGQGGHLRAAHDQAAGKRTRQLRVRRERIRVPAVVLEAAPRRRARSSACSSWPDSPRARTASWCRRSSKRERAGAEGFVLDMRANGGGLLDEAVLVSSAFVPNGVIVTTKGRKRPKRVFEATGEIADAQAGRGARRPRHGERVRDRDRRAARAPRRARRRPAHVRQGRVRPDLRPLQRRRARPRGRQLLHARRAQPERQGHQAGHPRRGRSRHAARRGARSGR